MDASTQTESESNIYLVESDEIAAQRRQLQNAKAAVANCQICLKKENVPVKYQLYVNGDSKLMAALRLMHTIVERAVAKNVLERDSECTLEVLSAAGADAQWRSVRYSGSAASLVALRSIGKQTVAESSNGGRIGTRHPRISSNLYTQLACDVSVKYASVNAYMTKLPRTKK